MSKEPQVTARSFIKTKKKVSLKIPNLIKLIGFKNFFWLIGLITVAAILHLKGTPKILWEYTYTNSNSKTSCTYIGLSTHTIPATAGDCSVFVLLRD